MKFLVAIDGSQGSQHALDKTVQLASVCQASVVLLTVVEPVLTPYYPTVAVMPMGDPLFITPGIGAQEREEQTQKAGQAILDHAQGVCQQAHLTCQTLLKRGSVREIICDVANDEAPDILVIGSRGLGSVERLMLGSVSDYVIHHAPCPVLVVR
jgi:nucleotide-binding universal stress UspA family protein